MTNPNIESQYLNILRELVDLSSEQAIHDRTGTGTHRLFVRTMRHHLSDGFPVLTSKRLYWVTAFKEMLWMLRGGRNIRELLLQNVHIWSQWPYNAYCRAQQQQPKQLPALTLEEFEAKIENPKDASFARHWGDLGPVYGVAWRQWTDSAGKQFDQVKMALDAIRDDPGSRRIIIEGWNVPELPYTALPPCHAFPISRINSRSMNSATS